MSSSVIFSEYNMFPHFVSIPLPYQNMVNQLVMPHKLGKGPFTHNKTQSDIYVIVKDRWRMLSMI